MPLPLSPTIRLTALALTAVAFSLLSAPAAAQSYACKAPPLDTNCTALVPDNTTVNSVITVLPGACEPQATIVSTAVHLKLSHQWVGDVNATLIHPDGTQVALLLRTGVGSEKLYGCSNEDVDVTFTDGAATAAGGQCNATFPAISGNVLPLNPLSALNGKSRNGAWTLRVADAAGYGIGALDAWSLDLPCTLPAVNVVATEPTAIVGAQPGRLTFTRAGATTGPLVVTYTLSGSAAPNAYDTLPGTIAIPDGAASATLDIVPRPTGIPYDTTVVATVAPSVVYAAAQPNTATVTIRGSVCGNGIVDTGEACDNGPNNGEPGDSCARNCTVATAGTSSSSGGGAPGGSSSGDASDDASNEEGGGCSCSVGDSSAPAGSLALALATTALARRLTRRRTTARSRREGDSQ